MAASRDAYWLGKVAVVTGGSAGLGLALATALVEAGARVMIVGRDAEKLAAAAEQLAARAEPGGSDQPSVSTCAADITTADDVQRVFQQVERRYGQLDLLLNNAGRSDRGLLLETPLERLRELWELNFLASIACAQRAAPLLLRSRGHLVFIGSLAAKSAARYLGAYPSSKFPLAAAAQQLRLELGPQGLHVMLVCPGPIARQDEGQRYDEAAGHLPAEARRPGGGVKLRGIEAPALARRILHACERRRAELVLPAKARLLFALAQLAPTWSDWLVLRKTTSPPP